MKRTQLVVTLAALLAVWCPQIGAMPFTEHFDTLIADLESRAETLSNSTDKVEQKQFKTLQKVIGTLESKPSLSLATDIKNLGKVAKTLAKAFPGDFAPTPGAFSVNLEAALQGLADDVLAVIDPVQTTLAGLGGSACATKIQTMLTTASNLVVQAASATDFATAAKLLGSGLKSGLKAAVGAASCTSGGGGGGGGNGDFMKATIRGGINFDLSTSSAVPPTATLTPAVLGTSFLIIAGAESTSGIDAIGVAIGVDTSKVTGPGTYPLGAGCNVNELSPSRMFAGATGTVTFTTFDLANQKVEGTFSFTATQVIGGFGTVTVSNGSFRISKITQN